MKLFAWILILTILVVFFMYFSKNHSSVNMRKQLKETFIDSLSLVDAAFSETIPITDAEIQEKKQEIEKKEEDLERLNGLLFTLNEDIAEKRKQLNDLNTLDGELNRLLDNIGIAISDLNSDIRTTYSDAVFVKESTPIDIFTLTQVEARKNRIDDEITALKNRINNALVHYDEEDISTIQKIGDLQSGLIKDLNNVKTVYDNVYKVLKKNTSFVEICSGNSLVGYPQYVQDYINSFDRDEICKDIDVTNLEANFNTKTELNYELGSNICSSKKGTCIYERVGENGGPKSYYTDTFDYKFYRHKWPQEDSCEAQSNACFSFGTLSDRACDGDIKTLYFIKEDSPAVYYSSDVGYRSSEIPGAPGNWNCIVDHPSPWIDRVDTIKQTASNNCLLNDGGYGDASYDCYSVTSDKINPTKSNLNTKSKTWRNTDHGDGSIGECVIDNTCRTINDTDNHVNCLKEDYSSTGNFQCHAPNDNGLNAIPGQYRNTYTLGTWNSETNKMELGVCSTTTGECRTKQDVEAEIDCLNTDNWSCAAFNFQPHASNIGSVEVIENTVQKRKTYTKLDYIQLDNTNQGVGTCSINNSCLSPTDLQNQADCHNSVDNYRCWTVNGTTHNTYQTENQMFKNWSDNECNSNDRSCMNRDTALSTAEDACHANVADRCYKIEDNPVDDTNADGSKNIIYDEGDSNQYPRGRKTKFTITDTSGTCSQRGDDDCVSNLNTLCSTLSVNCYNSENGSTPTPTQMVYNNNTENMKCVPPQGCSLIPHCSYMTVYTGNSNVFDSNDIGKVDCSEGNAYGKMYAWNLESTSMDSINNPGGFSSDYGQWTAIMEEDSGENTLCVRDASKMNNPLELTSISEETDDYACSNCPLESLDPNEGWTSDDVPGTENAEGRFYVYTPTSPDEEVDIVSIGSGLTDNSDGTISYNTKASNQGACPNPNASIIDISVYNQKKVVKHTRTIIPDPQNSEGCVAKTKTEVKYTLEDAGSRCPFNCFYYWGSNVNDPTEFYEGCYECRDNIGDGNTAGMSGWINNLCTKVDCKSPNSYRYPIRVERGGTPGNGCSGNGLNSEDVRYDSHLENREQYPKWLDLKKECSSMPLCACTVADYSSWAPPPGDTTTPTDWNREASSVPCGQTYTHIRTLSSDCDRSGLDATQTITHTGVACCTPVTGDALTWTEWTDSSGNSYGNSNEPNCPTDLCGGSNNDIEVSRNSINKVICNADGTKNIDQDIARETCEANAIPSAGSVSSWSSCPLCVDAGNTATQTGTITGRQECNSNGRIVSAADSSTTRDCSPQPPTCGPISGTRRVKSGATCSPNRGAICDWSRTPPSKDGTRPAEIEHNILTGTGKEWKDDGTMDCTVPCTIPQAPNNLRASAITYNSFTLTWNPNTNGDATLSNYTIMYRPFISTEGGITYRTPSWQQIDVSSSSTFHTISGLESGTSYYVRIKKNFENNMPDGVISTTISFDTLVYQNLRNLNDLPENSEVKLVLMNGRTGYLIRVHSTGSHMGSPIDNSEFRDSWKIENIVSTIPQIIETMYASIGGRRLIFNRSTDGKLRLHFRARAHRVHANDSYYPLLGEWGGGGHGMWGMLDSYHWLEDSYWLGQSSWEFISGSNGFKLKRSGRYLKGTINGGLSAIAGWRVRDGLEIPPDFLIVDAQGHLYSPFA